MKAVFNRYHASTTPMSPDKLSKATILSALDRLNDGVKGFISDEAEFTSDGMPIYSNLRIMRPTTEYLLAMKCLASPAAEFGVEGDRADIINLLKTTGLRDPAEICDLVASYYKESLLPPRIRFYIEEIVSELFSDPAP